MALSQSREVGRRYADLSHQRIDVETAIRAVIAASVAAPAVIRSSSVHAWAEYARVTMGGSRLG